MRIVMAIVTGFVMVATAFWLFTRGDSHAAARTRTSPRVITSKDGPPTKTAAPTGGTLAPIARLEESKYDFGLASVGQTLECSFLVRNDGQADLKLKMGKASCDCIEGSVLDEAIPPGKRGRVEISLTPPQPAREFSQKLELRTNDPAHPTLEFDIVGRVSNRLSVWPEALVFPEIRPWDKPSATLIVYSHEWRQFEIDKLEAVPEFLNCTVGPAEPADLAHLGARSGYRVMVSIDGSLPRGPFGGALRLFTHTAEDAQSSDAAPLEVRVSGLVSGYYALHGKDVNSDTGAVMLDTLSAGEGAKRSLLLTVGGDHRELTIREITTDPAFLKVRVTPDLAGGKPGRYRVELEVPRDAPLSDRGPTNPAEVHICTDHPQAPELDFKVQFIIAPRTR